MSGQLTVKMTTHNEISVDWKVDEKCLNGTVSVTSPCFALIADGHLILFSLTTDWSSGYKIRVTQNVPESGRAILTLSLDRPDTTVHASTHLIENWNKDYQCDCPGPAPNSVVDCYDRRHSGQSKIYVSMTITCDITWLGFVNPCKMQRIPHSPHELCLPQISYTHELQSDVKLIMDDQELSAHKNVLTLHSPVFLGMFAAPMKESKESRVVIEDVDFATMETLLKILYSGGTEELDDVQVALKVLAVAEKYQMMSIKRACEYKLQLNVKEANIVELLNEGDKYNATELLNVCIEYIIVVKDLISREEFEQMCLKRPNLSAAFITTQMKKLWSIPIINRARDS